MVRIISIKMSAKIELTLSVQIMNDQNVFKNCVQKNVVWFECQCHQ